MFIISNILRTANNNSEVKLIALLCLTVLRNKILRPKVDLKTDHFTTRFRDNGMPLLYGTVLHRHDIP